MSTGDKNNFEKAFNMLSQIIANIDNINNKEILKDKLQSVQCYLENVKLD